MDMRDFERAGLDRLFALQPGRARTLRLRPGDAVEAFSGTVWLTQEGMLDDVILASGEKFLVKERGPIVISALNAAALVRIDRPESAHVPLTLSPEVITMLHAQARALRRAELSRLAGVVSSYVEALWTFVRNQIAKWSKVIKAAGIKVTE